MPVACMIFRATGSSSAENSSNSISCSRGWVGGWPTGRQGRCTDGPMHFANRAHKGPGLHISACVHENHWAIRTIESELGWHDFFNPTQRSLTRFCSSIFSYQKWKSTRYVSWQQGWSVGSLFWRCVGRCISVHGIISGTKHTECSLCPLDEFEKTQRPPCCRPTPTSSTLSHWPCYSGRLAPSRPPG